MLPLGAAPAPLDDHNEHGRRWWSALTILVAIRAATPLIALTFSGRSLPGLPGYRYQPFNGDSFGYHAAAREFLGSIHSAGPVLLVVLVGLCTSCVILGALLWRRAPERRVAALVLPAAAASVAIAFVVHEMHPPGAPVFGWPLLWAVGMLPVRALGETALTDDVAFAIGLVLALAALAVTVVATAYVGLYASGRRSVGLIASGAFTAWPLLTGQIVGHSAWENGQWAVDVGLHLYTEPVSTALVVTSVALLLRPATQALGTAGAGFALGYATLVKLTNGVVGLVLFLLVARRHGIERAAPLGVAGLVALPVLVAYWPKGYVGQYGGGVSASEHPWSLTYLGETWGRSSLFTPRLLLLLAPLLVVGCIALADRWALAYVGAPIVVTVAIYSVYDVTSVHPRFLYVALPFLFVIEAAGLVAIIDAVRRRSGRLRQVRVL